MDEDFVKKCMHIASCAHGSARPVSLLQKWLLQWPENLAKAAAA